MKKNIKLTKEEIKKFAQYRKLEIKYSILILVFIFCVASITATVLIINFKEQGTSHIVKEYFDVKLMNATMDYESETTVKLEDNKIIISIKDLSTYKNTNSINLEIKNIGSTAAMVNFLKIYKSSIDSDINNTDVNINLKKGDIIEGSETKIINIDIKCNDKNVKDTDSIDIFINMNFNEIEM